MGSECEDFDGENKLLQLKDVPSPSDPPVPKRRKQKSYRKKVETSWSHENILKLIHEVELRRSLWDIECAEYKGRKDSIWQEVADAIPVSFNDCKGKWANLRITFNCNLDKLRKKKIGQDTDESTPIAWKYFKPMMFLEKVRQSSSYMQECATTDESVCNDLGLSDEVSQPSPPPPFKHRNRNSITPTFISSSSNRHNSGLKEVAVETLHAMDALSKDSSTAFGEYIAAELRSLAPEQATYARAKLRRAFNDIMDEVSLMNPQRQEIVVKGSRVMYSVTQLNPQ